MNSQQRITNGNRGVIISNQEGTYHISLWVNVRNGWNDPTICQGPNRTWKTESGVKKYASRWLSGQM